MKHRRVRIEVTFDDCPHRFILYRGWLSRFANSRQFQEAMVQAEQHECKER